jgi:hypothetical protein
LQHSDSTELIFSFIHAAKGNEKENDRHDESDKNPIGNTETKHHVSSLAKPINFDCDLIPE